MAETRRRPGPAPKLSRDAVLEVARDLEPEALTLTAIGAKLGVTGPALYRYFPDRTAILEALANEAREQLVPPDLDLPWDRWLMEAAQTERALWKAHSDLYEAANYRAISRPMLRMSQAGLTVLTRAGFSAIDAFCGLTLVSEVAHALGWVESHGEALFDPTEAVEVLGPVLMPYLDELVTFDIDEMFTRSVSMAIDGLRSRLAR